MTPERETLARRLWVRVHADAPGISSASALQLVAATLGTSPLDVFLALGGDLYARPYRREPPEKTLLPPKT